MGSDIAEAAMFRILKKSGAERVSSESAIELRDILEEIAAKISKNAVDMASHAKRKTVKADDVKLAARMYSQS